ncbi:saccharopine dehydrogenase NADP-binding domain-containing protein [Rhodococcus daqingensis]|uniref:Saccharopine dehydrogenase NADP-binding domain-containing protein n=1 Tax=Rhodococcus daqingensis TaxID=2479363 RepID=A0ABW2RTJ5_9NOCA
MKVVIVGGAGRVGTRIAQELSRHSHVEVRVADRTQPRDPGLDFSEVDLADVATLDTAIAGADVVVNTAGPFDRWGTVVLDAAIASGVNYVDVCDDPIPTAELLDRDDAARAAGVRAVIGLGMSPGLTNFLAVVAARQLDSVDLLATFWGDPGEGKSMAEAETMAAAMASAFEEGRAAFHHLIVQASAMAPIWRDGQQAECRAWKEAYRVTTSSGATGVFRMIGHPEPVTLPRAVDVQECVNVGTIDAGSDALMLPTLDRVSRGEIDVPTALKFLAAQLRARPQVLATPRVGPALSVFGGAAVTGERDGLRSGVVVLPGGPVDGSMSLETARPAAVGVLSIDSAEVGVHAPESAFDADAFLAKFSDIYWDGVPGFVVDEAGPDAIVRVEP